MATSSTNPHLLKVWRLRAGAYSVRNCVFGACDGHTLMGMAKLRKITTVFLVGAGVYLMIPALIRDVSPTSCAKWNDRVVPVDTISADQLMQIAQDTQVIVLPASMNSVLPRQGISLPGVVAVLESQSRYNNANLRWHEMVHQYQYDRDGIFVFFKNYAGDFHTGLLKGCTPLDAYRGIGYELEADIAADSIHRYTDMYSAILDPAQVRLGEVPEKYQKHKPGSRPRPNDTQVYNPGHPSLQCGTCLGSVGHPR